MYKPPRVRRGKFSQRKREEVKAFSSSSARRMARYLRHCIARYSTFITLTYPSREGYGYDGRQCKRDLKVFLQRLKRQFGADKAYSTFWFSEFQKNGSVHFHMFCTRFVPKKFLSQVWYEIVGSGSIKHLLSGTNVTSVKAGKKGMINYARKYAAKQAQKTIPEGFLNFGRFWGISGERGVEAVTLPLDDLSELVDDWEDKLMLFSDYVGKLVVQGKATEYEVLLERVDSRGNMVRDKDISCTMWTFKDPVSIKTVYKMLQDIKRIDPKARISAHGWLCQANNMAAMKAKSVRAFGRVDRKGRMTESVVVGDDDLALEEDGWQRA